MAERILPRDFYVYLHRKKTTGEVFYVGKGMGKRAWNTERNSHWKNTVAKHGLVIEIVQDGLCEWFAFELEIRLIAFYGRADIGLGTLVNWTDGGEGASGCVVSQETRAKLSAASLLANSDPSVKAKRSQSLRAVFSIPEVRARHLAAVRIAQASPEVNAKRSASLIKANASPDVKRRRSAASVKSQSRPEVRLKMSNSVREARSRPESKLRYLSASIEVGNRPDVKMRKSAAMSDKRWYNNGLVNRRLSSLDQISDDFVPGRLIIHQAMPIPGYLP